MKKQYKRFISMVLLVIMVVGMLPTSAIDVSSKEVSLADHVVINQVYGGGGNSGATYTNDFIELFNPTDEDIDLDGWSVQYASSTGTFNSTTNLSGVIKAGGYYLIQQAAGSGGTESLPTPDIEGSINMSAKNCKVALVEGTDKISGKDDETVVDFVGIGSANEYEGTDPAPQMSNTTAAIRKVSGYDTDDNSVDFEVDTPYPRNSEYNDEDDDEDEVITCQEPIAMPDSGTVEVGTEVELTTTTDNAMIYYTTDGSNPDENSALYSEAITINEATTIKAIAIKEGMENSNIATFSYTLKTNEDTISIKEFKSLNEGEEGIVEGIVLNELGSIGSYNSFYMQDDTSGVFVFYKNTSNELNIEPGDKISVSGTNGIYNGLIQLQDPEIEVLDRDGNLPETKVVKAEDLDAENEGQLLEINDLKITEITEANSYGSAEIIAEDSTGEVTIFLDNRSGYYYDDVVEKIQVGDIVTITGINNFSSNSYRLFITNVDDLVINEDNTVEDGLEVIANPDSGSVESGTEVILSSQEGADIYYTLDGSNPTTESIKYEEPIVITERVTIKVIATMDGMSSEVAEFNYNILGEAMTIKEVLELGKETEDVTVQGQISYFVTSYNNPVIQYVIDGQIYSLYIYGAAPEGAEIGDVVEFTGKYTIYNGLPEMMSLTNSSIVDTTKEPIEAEVVTIEELKSNGKDMIGRFVKIEDVTLGSYSESGSTPVTDETGTINIYRATAYPEGIEEGEVVDLYAMVAIYNSTIQLYTGTADGNGFNVYDVVNDTKPPVITLPDSFLNAKVEQDYSISVDVVDNKDVDSVSITYTIGDIEKTEEMIKGDSGKYTYTIPGDEIIADASEITFIITATDVSDLVTVSEEVSITIDNMPQVISVTPARGSATGTDKTPEISVTIENAGIDPTVILNLIQDDDMIIEDQEMAVKEDEDDIVYTYIPEEALSDGRYTAEVTITREDEISYTETWYFTVGESQYTQYYGQLHAHTTYSDGSGTLTDALNYFSNIPSDDNVDFISITDHSNYFDTTSNANPAEALNDISLMSSESLALWQAYTGEMSNYNEANVGDKVVLSGFEMTWSGGPGHINTFNSDGLISRNDSALNSKTSDAGMKLYYDTLIENTDPLANLSQFNHPGTTFGTFNDFAYWSPAYDNKMVAVEVGNGEGAIGSGGYFPSYQYYTMALDKGWHVGPTNNQDNHRGSWGNSNTARTVIIADELAEDALLQGLADRSMYSTEDQNLNINYTLNDQVMGSIISEVPTEPLQFDIQVNDPDSEDIISKIEVISNSGRVVASETFSSNSVDWRFELPVAEGYYYVRVTQADKDIAVTSPVWIGQTPVIGISSVTSDVSMPVTYESLTVTTTLFNNESSDAVLKSITYMIDDEVLKTEQPEATIGTMGTLQQEFEYTPELVGTVTIDVIAEIELNGVVSEFSQGLELNVRDSESLVYVGFDASHYNEYVDGNYKDSMGNFANLAEEFGVRVVYLNTEEALIDATQNEKFEMLIFTPPTRRDGSAFKIGYESYSDEVIEAVGDFAALGKTVIITNWGDYYEGYNKFTDGTAHTLPAEEHMAAQQNQLLESIGASLRVSDDEIKDDIQNGGQAQRLYLTEYNMENEFLSSVLPDEQVYSNYGGSTIYATDENGQPTTTLPGSVSPMVYGFETSYSADDDGDNYAGIEIPKYDDKYMVAAHETVTHDNGNESTVIVAGAVFMSNFEIQADMDNYSTPAYSNYTIAENILRTVSPVEVTDIADVQAAEEGERFTIQGIATSNASGYDKDTAFFDSIYVQDETAGINAFPVSGDIQAGQTVEITGTTGSYNGERQITVESIRVIDYEVNELPDAKELTTEEAAAGKDLGSLVSITGEVVSYTAPNDVVETIMVKDESGVEARVFIDGYITADKIIEDLEEGAIINAVGLSSIDTEGTRIRIRDRDDVICELVEDIDDDDSSNEIKPDEDADTDEDTNTDTDVDTDTDEDTDTDVDADTDTDEDADTDEDTDTDVDADTDEDTDTDTDVDTDEDTDVDTNKDTDVSSAKTGDGFNIWLHVLMFIVSAAGLVFGVYYIRKRKTV